MTHLYFFRLLNLADVRDVNPLRCENFAEDVRLGCFAKEQDEHPIVLPTLILNLQSSSLYASSKPVDLSFGSPHLEHCHGAVLPMSLLVVRRETVVSKRTSQVATERNDEPIQTNLL